EGRLPIQDFYLLPAQEMMAKMISVSFYFGGIDTHAFRERFGTPLQTAFPSEMDFLRKRGYMRDEGERFMLTAQGKDVLSGIIPLFYSTRSQENLMTYTPRGERP
ncbi:MAG: coproporphyrinogen III oxidase, partial [Nanoarchaeota archaeon]